MLGGLENMTKLNGFNHQLTLSPCPGERRWTTFFSRCLHVGKGNNSVDKGGLGVMWND